MSKRIGQGWVVVLLVLLLTVPALAVEEKPTLELFNEVFQFTLDNYVEHYDPAVLEEMAIRGLLEQLDPYSQYFTANDYEDFQSDMEGRFGGVGLQLEKAGDVIFVVSPLRGTPGERSGILPGDVITAVDGQSIHGMILPRVVDLIRGEPGTTVTLTIAREGEDTTRAFTLTRELIELIVLEYEMLEGKIGYIKLTSFTSSSTLLYAQAINALTAEGARGFILDIRNNPGGYLGAALSVASPFLENGQDMLHVQSRADGDNTYFSTSRSLDLPLAVLINKGSASGSEIVAGAVQDHQVGTIVGTSSFGKATVQHIFDLSNEGGLKLTTAEYLTPNRRQIKDVGILPDIHVEDPQEQFDTAVRIIQEKIAASLGERTAVDMLTFRLGEKILWNDGRPRNLPEAPYLSPEGVVMVPLRVTAEQLGAVVRYDANLQRIELQLEAIVVHMYPDGKEMEVNGNRKALSAPVSVKQGTTMVPIRDLAESLGAQVTWNEGVILVK